MSKLFLLPLLLVFLACTTPLKPASPDPAPGKGLVLGLAYTDRQWAALAKGEDRLLNYTRALTSRGAKVIPFHVDQPEAEIAANFATIDGLVLPGGSDVHPKYYNETGIHELEETEYGMDILEFNLMEKARAMKTPVLGICRGFQFLNVWRGGSLWQDIPSQYKPDKAAGQKPVEHRIKINNRSQMVYHPVTLVKGTSLYGLYKRDRIIVNTYHHQGVKKLGNNLRVSATSDDGIVEGFESTDDHYLLGVQFHPEKFVIEDPENEMNLVFQEFMQTVGKQKRGRKLE